MMPFFVSVPSYCVAGAVSEKHVLAHKGWPHRILCSTVLVSSNYNIYDWYEYSSEEPVMQVRIYCKLFFKCLVILEVCLI